MKHSCVRCFQPFCVWERIVSHEQGVDKEHRAICAWGGHVEGQQSQQNYWEGGPVEGPFLLP